MKKLLSHIILELLLLFIVSCMPQNEVGTPFHNGQEVTIYASMPYNNSGGEVLHICLINSVSLEQTVIL